MKRAIFTLKPTQPYDFDLTAAYATPPQPGRGTGLLSPLVPIPQLRYCLHVRCYSVGLCLPSNLVWCLGNGVGALLKIVDNGISVSDKAKDHLCASRHLGVLNSEIKKGAHQVPLVSDVLSLRFADMGYLTYAYQAFALSSRVAVLKCDAFGFPSMPFS